MQKNRLTYHLKGLIDEFKAQITEEVATSVVKSLSESSQLNADRSQEDCYLTTAEAASLFKICKSQIVKLRKKHKDFPVIKIGTAVRFKRSELEVFFKKSKIK
ncbi:helix-turn-helix domain-containing protein [Flavivirga abyssicola]|uniref:helix-turn-helix domain-containing protein n=1 Tax=Flavivirga abyssicola TaxID=3063533 RepID=UPI0026DF86C5|nr:helix-turn-helix domain-containing protein [Flavivirga sp. MEBiC07777]WVK14037.1 helix-turn-helix domain-containing protein [Flavivirga sp. MEBiC07777]